MGARNRRGGPIEATLVAAFGFVLLFDLLTSPSTSALITQRTETAIDLGIGLTLGAFLVFHWYATPG